MTRNYTKYDISCHQFWLSWSILIVTHSILSQTLNVSPTLFVTRNFFGGVIDLQCCNYCRIPSDFSSKFQSSMTILHHKMLTREGRVLANGWTHPSSMIVFVHLFIKNRIQKATIVTLNTIWHKISYLVYLKQEGMTMQKLKPKQIYLLGHNYLQSNGRAQLQGAIQYSVSYGQNMMKGVWCYLYSMSRLGSLLKSIMHKHKKPCWWLEFVAMWRLMHVYYGM